MTRRQERVSEQIHRVLSELLAFETQDPRLANVTITRAEITGDLRRAAVYILPSGNAEESQAALESLRHAQGYLRHAVAESLQLRFAPELDFALDEQTAKADRVQQLLDELKE